MFTPARRATVLIPSGPQSDPTRKHLFVLLTYPYGTPEQILLVPICSVPPDGCHDGTCPVGMRDHPFLKHDSYVAYDKCRVEFSTAVTRLVDNHYFVEKGMVSEELVLRIAAGLKVSKFTKPFAKKFLIEFEQSLKPSKHK